MIDPKEKLISFKTASELPLAPVTKYTIRNWALHGAHGVHLDFLKIGGRYFTSAEALQRFLVQCRENNWQGIWNGEAYDALLNRRGE